MAAVVRWSQVNKAGLVCSGTDRLVDNSGSAWCPRRGDVRSIYCRLRVGCNGMLHSKAVRATLCSARCSSCGSRGGHDCQCGWPRMLLPRADHTSFEPPQSFDGCHRRQGLLLVSTQRARQTTLCHGLAETDTTPRGSKVKILFMVGVEILEKRGRASGCWEKDRCCPALRSTVNVISQWD